MIDNTTLVYYACVGCDYNTTDRSDLDRHVRVKHKTLAESMKWADELNQESSNKINPPYYRGRDVMDIINRYSLSFCLGTVLKYILKAKNKNGVEDLKKARWYLEEEIRILENDRNENKS